MHFKSPELQCIAKGLIHGEDNLRLLMVNARTGYTMQYPSEVTLEGLELQERMVAQMRECADQMEALIFIRKIAIKAGLDDTIVEG